MRTKKVARKVVVTEVVTTLSNAALRAAAKDLLAELASTKVVQVQVNAITDDA